MLLAQNPAEQSVLVHLKTTKDTKYHHPKARSDNRSPVKDHLSISHLPLISRRIRTERDSNLQTKVADHQKSIATNHQIAPGKLRHVLPTGQSPIENHLLSVTRAVDLLETSIGPESRKEREDRVLLRVPTASKSEDHHSLHQVLTALKSGDRQVLRQVPTVSKSEDHQGLVRARIASTYENHPLLLLEPIALKSSQTRWPTEVSISKATIQISRCKLHSL